LHATSNTRQTANDHFIAPALYRDRPLDASAGVLVRLPNLLVVLPKGPSEDVREKILDAALSLLGDHGVRWLTQPRVAEKAGVRQSHVTYYFPRRSDLIGAVARRYIESAGVEMLEIFQRAEFDDVGQLLTAFAYKQVGDRRRSRTLMGLLVASEEDAALRAQMVQAVRTLRSVIAQALGVDEGDPKATIVQATLWGLGINHLLMGGAEDEVELKTLIDLVAKQQQTEKRVAPRRSKKRKGR
jgi:AcrR family transcriptional regulator